MLMSFRCAKLLIFKQITKSIHIFIIISHATD